MPLISSSIPNLINGVSQQPAALRLASQCEQMVNCMPSPVEGLKKRPPAQHVAKLFPGSAGFSRPFTTIVDRDGAIQYLVLILDNDIKVFGLDGSVKTVAKPDGTSYLDITGEPSAVFRVASVADYTFIVNRQKTVAMAATTSPTWGTKSMVFIRSADYATTYSITVNSTTVTYATANAGGSVPSTVDIALNLRNSLAAALGGTWTITASEFIVRITKNDGTDYTLGSSDTRIGTATVPIKGTVDTISDLPTKAEHGFIVKILGAAATGADDYYVKFVTTAGSGFGHGVWQETVAPAIQYLFDATTMPHVLVRETDGTFTFRKFTWSGRVAGDAITAPNPSFVGSTIQNINLFRNRLALLADENVILSAADAYDRFWPESVQTVVDSDPIDLSAGSRKINLLTSSLAFADVLLVFSRNGQFRLSGGNAVAASLTPKTATITQVTAFEMSQGVDPVIVGRTMYFPVPKGEYGGLREFFLPDASGPVPTSEEVTAAVPRFLPSDLSNLVATAAEEAVYAVSKSQPRRIYLYKFLFQGDNKLQSAWSYWEFGVNKSVIGIDLVESDLYVVVQYSDGVYLERIVTHPEAVDAGTTVEMLVDRKVTEADCSVALTTPSGLDVQSTITLPYPISVANDDLVVTQDNYLALGINGLMDAYEPVDRTWAHYRLERNTSDEFANYANGDNIGNFLFKKFGTFALASFNGTTQYFRTDPESTSRGFLGSAGTRDNSVLLWFRFTTLPSTTKYLWIASNAAQTIYTGLRYNNATQKLEYVRYSQGVANVTVVSVLSISANITYTTCCRYTSATGLQELFVNNVLQNSTTSASTLAITAGDATCVTVGYSITEGYTAVNIGRFRLAGLVLTDISRMMTIPTIQIFFGDTVVSNSWIVILTATTLGFTVPTGLTPATYFVYALIGGISNVPIQVRYIDLPIRDTALSVRFDSSDGLDTYFDRTKPFGAMTKGWGGANGGVVAENVSIGLDDTGTTALILESHGDNYTGTVQGVDRAGNPKYNANGTPWVKRVGAVVVSKDYFGFGRYEYEAKVVQVLGVASAFWHFHYQEVYPDDPRWDSYINDLGLRPSGDSENGYYIVRNNEIDIELPSHLLGGNIEDPSLSNGKFNTWRGELQNYDVAPGAPGYWEEYRDNYRALGFNAANGQYHVYRYDWYHDRVEFYVDNVLIVTNINNQFGYDSNNIPNVAGKVTIGPWFPSGAVKWAGPTADFDVEKMYVKSFNYTPFTSEITNHQVLVGETYGAPVATPENANMAVVGRSFAGNTLAHGQAPQVLSWTANGGTGGNGTITVRGDLTGAQFFVGELYDMSYEFSTQYLKEQPPGGGMAVIAGPKLQLRTWTMLFDKSSSFSIKVTPRGRDTQVYPYTGFELGDQDISLGELALRTSKFRVPVMAQNIEAKIEVVSSSPLPCRLQSAEWEGWYHTRAARL